MSDDTPTNDAETTPIETPAASPAPATAPAVSSDRTRIALIAVGGLLLLLAGFCIGHSLRDGHGSKRDHVMAFRGGVHDAREDGDAGALDGDDEGGGGRVGGGLGAEEPGVVVRDEEADEGEGNGVEEGDAPKDLLDGAGKGFPWVDGLGGG
jgi:hypothetical protein